jgi:ElaB/YqjD/DUF883 family membrane-anchored ribosome-binding protein
MSMQIHSEPPTDHFPEAAGEVAQTAADTVKDLAGTVEDATKDAGERAKDLYHTAALKAGETLATSKEYVRRNPVPVVLGAVAFGLALGYLLVKARRTPLFGDRHADEPLVAVREAVLGALAPVKQRVHKGYDTAREGAGKIMGGLHDFSSGRAGVSLPDQIGRIGNNLKFW